jgi:hypothetical protein
MNYTEFANATSSEKIVLAWMQASQRAMVWTVHSGSIYYKDVPEFVTGVIQDGTSLTNATSVAGIDAAGKWFFDPTAKRLYVRTTGSADPDSVFVRLNYRLFFSNAPIDLPWDLSTGTDVEYLPIIQSTSQFGYEIDPDQFGVALEGQGEIVLENTDGYMDARFERYWWENKPVVIYSYSPSIPLTEKKVIYRGVVAAKRFSSSEVSFAIADFISMLGNNISLSLFDGTEGNITSSALGTPKRRVYGRVSGLRCVGIDHILNGFEITGTVSNVAGDTVLAGSGTAFLDEVTPDDEVRFGDDYYKVKSVDSNTQITINSSLETNISAGKLIVRSKFPWRKKNREWLIAGHPLKKISTTIDAIVQANRITLDDPTDFEAGDIILVDGVKAQIRRISGPQVVLEQNLDPLPTIGDEVSKYPVQGVNEGERDFVFLRDFSITNSGSSSILVLENLAEFNTAPAQALPGTITFTSGSRTVTASGSAFKGILNPRDWIRPAVGTWYEILSVDSDTQVTLRIAFAQSTVASSACERKNIQAISDESIITVDCFGATDDGTEDGVWLKTGAQVVRDLIREAGISDAVNEAAFTEAASEAPFVMSLKIPTDFQSKSIPTVKESIDLVNQSIMGALHFNSSFELAMSIVSAKKPAALVALQDDDIISWQIDSRVDHIRKEIICRYRHEDADRTLGEPASSYESRVNTVAERLSDTLGTDVKDLYLYDESNAQLIAQRYALMAESASSMVRILSKLNLTTIGLAEKMYVLLDRLFYRLGSTSARRKIGIVTSVKKDGLNTIVEIDDISGMWNKVATFAPSGASEYDAATEDEAIRNGYFTDNNGIITGYEDTYRINLIG